MKIIELLKGIAEAMNSSRAPFDIIGVQLPLSIYAQAEDELKDYHEASVNIGREERGHSLIDFDGLSVRVFGVKFLITKL